MIRYSLPQTGEMEQQLWRTGQRLGAGELFGLAVRHDFERMNLLGLAREEARIEEAEREEGTFDPAFAELVDESGVGTMPDKSAASHQFAMSAEDWRASEWYREGIEHSAHMTPTRARILAEVYDRRRGEERLLEMSADTLGRKAILFGAGLVASLPDPINFIPLGGALVRGGSVGAKTARGALEGAVGSAVADAIIFPTANARGEDFGFMDAALDLTFGALIGGGLAFGGAKFAAWREPKVLARELAALEADVKSALVDTGLAADEAARQASALGKSLSEMPDALHEVRRLRRRMGGEDRTLVGLAMEKAIMDVAGDQAADVRLPLDAARRAGGAWLDSAPLMEAGRPNWAGLQLDELLPLAERYYLENYSGKSVETQKGTVNFTGKQGWKKLKGQAPDTEKLKLLPFVDHVLAVADWVAIEAPKREIHKAQGMKIHQLRAVLRFEGRDLDVRLVVREDVNGKLFYDFFNEGESGKNNAPPESHGQSAADRAKDGAKAERSSGAQSRQSDVQSGGDSTLSDNISAGADNVNLELRDVTPDTTPPRPETTYRAPEPPKSLADEMRAEGIDPKSGQSLDEADALRLAEEGKVTPEEQARLEAAQAESERANLREDIALGLVGCIIGTV